METYNDAPQVLRNFLSYHETVKGQSRRTVSEYYLDLRMFLRFVRLMREELPYKTPLDDIPIKAPRARLHPLNHDLRGV